MKDIKYRVWCKDNNEWEKDTVLMDDSGGLFQKKGFMSIQPLRKETHVVQFCTGLKDLNGNEIYDGDLVLVVDYPEWTDAYLVKFCEDNLCWALYDAYGYSESLNEFDKYDVVGNIYEEPWKLK